MSDVAPPETGLQRPEDANTWLDALTRGVAENLALLFAVVVILSCYDIVRDVFFGQPTIWVYEAVTVIIAVCFMFGGADAQQKNVHIRVTPLYDRYPYRVQRGCDLFSHFCTLVYLAVFGWFTWERFALIAIEKWERAATPWNQPTPVILKTAMVLGIVLLMLQTLPNLMRDVQKFRRGGPL
jgi:TRAP-type mannitol/chloroaromatic compound transport system permease small subunit